MKLRKVSELSRKTLFEFRRSYTPLVPWINPYFSISHVRMCCQLALIQVISENQVARSNGWSASGWHTSHINHLSVPDRRWQASVIWEIWNSAFASLHFTVRHLQHILFLWRSHRFIDERCHSAAVCVSGVIFHFSSCLLHIHMHSAKQTTGLEYLLRNISLTFFWQCKVLVCFNQNLFQTVIECLKK